MNWRPKLSFGFTVNRRLGICVGQLQNESQRFGSSRTVYVTLVNDTLAAFSITESTRWTLVKANGQLRYLDETSTLVSGEIQQNMPWTVLFFAAFIVAMTIVFIGNSGITGAILGLIWLFGYTIFVLLAQRSRVFRMLKAIKQYLDPNIVQPMSRKKEQG